MSLFQFISSNTELPQLFSVQRRFPDGALKAVIDCSDEIYDLEIIECPGELYRDIPFYTRFKYIYSIDWEASNSSNCKKLLEYLQSIDISNEIEIWTIRLCNITDLPTLENVRAYVCLINDLNIDYLYDKVKCEDSGDAPKVLKILPTKKPFSRDKICGC
jgi:hypothetical protein